jgi:photosystem II stability/assembly factor-like uncharacterized protein
MGCISYSSGVLWAGIKDVYMSSDFGSSWQKRSPSLAPGDNVIHITFYDSQTGLVCSYSGSVFITKDQGMTWRELRRVSRPTSAAFLGSVDNILISSLSSPSEIQSTRDGGVTWIKATPGTYIPDIKPLIGSSAVALVGYTPLSGTAEIHLMKTNDYGVTWTEMPGKVDFDTYSFDVDPCDPNYIYVVNEDGTTSRDGFAQIFYSSDAGNSWTPLNPHSVSNGSAYYSGSVWLTGKAVFVQTVVEGVLRSTDRGTSWKNIGGPSAPFDTRLVCAPNANLVFAVDANGSIWRTDNSGGDSLTIGSPYEALMTSPPRLFTTDTLLNCDTPVVSMARLRGGICKFPKILWERLTGPDSLDYKIVQSMGDSLRGNDSVSISFHPNASGARQGFYIIYLEDGTQISIPLEGFGKSPKSLQPLTASASTDTIGGWVQVPIEIKGLDKKQIVTLVLHYDPSLIYIGSYANDGTPIDLTGEGWQGRSKLSIDSTIIRLDSASGFAYFTVYPSEGPCPQVSLDSLNVISPTAPCEYFYGNGAAAEICPPAGCGIMILTNYLLHGEIPNIMLYPNPVANELNIISRRSEERTVISILDSKGGELIRRDESLKKGEPVKINIASLGSGVYFLRVVSPEKTQTLPFIKLQ